MLYKAGYDQCSDCGNLFWSKKVNNGARSIKKIKWIFKKLWHAPAFYEKRIFITLTPGGFVIKHIMAVSRRP